MNAGKEAALRGISTAKANLMLVEQMIGGLRVGEPDQAKVIEMLHEATEASRAALDAVRYAR